MPPNKEIQEYIGENNIQFHPLGTNLFWVYDISIDHNDEVQVDIRSGYIEGLQIYKLKNDINGAVNIEYTTRFTQDGHVSFINHSKAFLTEKQVIEFYVKNKINRYKDIVLENSNLLYVYEKYLQDLYK